MKINFNYKKLLGMISDQNKKITKELLWENNITADAFETQTINIDLSKYKNFLVVFRLSSVSNVKNSLFISEKNQKYRMSLLSGKIVYRDIIITDNGFTFEEGNMGETYGTNNTNTTVIIPLKLYGFM